MADDDVTAADRRRLAAAGEKYGAVTIAWRITVDDEPGVIGLCPRVGIVLADDDTVRLAYKRVGTRIAASGVTRTLEAATTSTSVTFADPAAAAEFDAAWSGAGAGASAAPSWSWRSWLAVLSGLLLFLAAVVLIAGIADAVVLFTHTGRGLVSDGFGGRTVGRVHPDVAVGFAVLIGSVAVAAVLAWCGVVGNYLIERLEPAAPD